MALFTYVVFLLAAPPYNLSPTLLGAIFVTYLVGGAAVLGLGRAVARFGRRTLILGTIAVWACGALIMLVPSVVAIIAGLAIAAGCGFVVQATSTASVALAAESGRTSAIGLYATCFYVGGSFGAILPGLTWRRGRLDRLRRHGDRDAGLDGCGHRRLLEALTGEKTPWPRR